LVGPGKFRNILYDVKSSKKKVTKVKTNETLKVVKNRLHRGKNAVFSATRT